MAILKIFSENNPSEFEFYDDLAIMQEKLSSINIELAKWACKEIKSSPEKLLEDYQFDIQKIMQEYQFKNVDVISMDANMDANFIKEIREKFLQEHIHTDDEVRFFVQGSGLFCIHAKQKIYAILCTRGDFIAVPAMTKHWFDTGLKPNFQCIRFFSDEAGWLAKYTKDPIAMRFPGLENFEAINV